MKILFLTTVLPSRKLHGSDIASQNIVDALTQAGHQVAVVGYARKEDGPFQPAPQEILVSERYIETKVAKWYPLLWFSLSLLMRLPYSSAKYCSSQYIYTVKSLLAAENYDLVILDHAQMGWLLSFLRNQKQLVLVAHNLEHAIYRQYFQQMPHSPLRFVYFREAQLVEALEAHLAHGVAEVWTLSQRDTHYFTQIKPAHQVRTLSMPSGFSIEHRQPTEKKFDIALIGSWTWKANREGLEWFLEQVYPKLPRTCSIHIAGRGADWVSGKYANVTYRGFVPDANVFMAEAKTVAIPIWVGSGIQIKTLDAIASGSSIVTTSIGLRGIAQPPTTVHVADNAEKFAQCLIHTVNTPIAPQTFHEALSWFTTRQEQFVQEIAQAVNTSTGQGVERQVSLPTAP